MELKELLVNLDPLGLLDRWVLPVLVVMKESRDRLGLLETKDFKATKVFPASLDCVAQEESLERKEKVDLKDSRDLRDLKVPWDLKDNRDPR